MNILFTQHKRLKGTPAGTPGRPQRAAEDRDMVRSFRVKQENQHNEETAIYYDYR